MGVMSRWIFVRGVAILRYRFLTLAPGLPKAAYLNPHGTARSFPRNAGLGVLDIVAQAKFLTLFALLFGAGLQMLRSAW